MAKVGQFLVAIDIMPVAPSVAARGRLIAVKSRVTGACRVLSGSSASGKLSALVIARFALLRLSRVVDEARTREGADQVLPHDPVTPTEQDADRADHRGAMEAVAPIATSRSATT